MQLYNLTLQKATNINHAVHGNYSGQKQQEIAVSRGTVVEILKECFINILYGALKILSKVCLKYDDTHSDQKFSESELYPLSAWKRLRNARALRG